MKRDEGFTPGPWTADGATITKYGAGIVARLPMPQNGGLFAAMSNARLIAAAPLMADFVYAHAARGDKEARAILETAGVSLPPESATLTDDEGQSRPGEPDGSRSALR